MSNQKEKVFTENSAHFFEIFIEKVLPYVIIREGK